MAESVWAMIETLFCENGQHSWERESKRGKKPKNCPRHTVDNLIKKHEEDLNDPNFLSGQQRTQVEKDLARLLEKRKNCPSQISILTSSEPHSFAERYQGSRSMPGRLLICEHDGHEWWAPVQRGRPPRFCPEHRPKDKGRIMNGYLAEKTFGPRPETPQTSADRAEKTIYKPKPKGKHVDHSSGIPTVMPTVETWCKGGQHFYQRERKRGKPPRNCPEHAVSGAIERKGELDQEKKEKAQKALQDEIARLSARVEDAEIVDRDAMTKLQAAGGVNKAEEEFKIWLRANTALLHEVEALRARERKLIET